MDSVEIMMCWEESLGVAVPDEQAGNVTTPAESVELLMSLVDIKTGPEACLSQLAFYKIREILIHGFGIERARIKPMTRFSTIFPKQGRRQLWADFNLFIGVETLSIKGFPLFGPGKTTIKSVVTYLVARKAQSLVPPQNRWSTNQLREVVRVSVVYVTGVEDFADSDHYINDIGID